MTPLTAQIIVVLSIVIFFVSVMLLLSKKNTLPALVQNNKSLISLSAAGAAAVAVFISSEFYNASQLSRDCSHDSKSQEQAAAICYRLNNESAQFYLVRTTGGRWTFPKGKIKQNEKPWLAAKREAFEEAGVTGEIDHKPLISYIHHKKEVEGSEVTVKAFVLKAETTENPQEEFRNPTWFNAAEAEKALAEDRNNTYAEEICRVIGAASSHITRRTHWARIRLRHEIIE